MEDYVSDDGIQWQSDMAANDLDDHSGKHQTIQCQSVKVTNNVKVSTFTSTLAGELFVPSFQDLESGTNNMVHISPNSIFKANLPKAHI